MLESKDTSNHKVFQWSVESGIRRPGCGEGDGECRIHPTVLPDSRPRGNLDGVSDGNHWQKAARKITLPPPWEQIGRIFPSPCITHSLNYEK
jgi:hypothetical protein